MNGSKHTRKWLWIAGGLTLIAALIVSGLSLFINKIIFPGQFRNFAETRPIGLEESMQPFAKTFPMGNERLEGWTRQIPGKPLVVYFGGNNEDVLPMAKKLSEWGCSLLTVNYRGFGRSTGTPSEKSIVEDEISLIRQTLKEHNIPWSNVVLVGKSIGSGVAVQVASISPAGRLVLMVPFLSLEETAQGRAPYLPVSLLLESPFRSDQAAPKITCPVSIFAATRDETIPIAQARQLSKLFPSLVDYREFDHISHNGLMSVPEFTTAIRQICTQSEKISHDTETNRDTIPENRMK